MYTDVELIAADMSPLTTPRGLAVVKAPPAFVGRPLGDPAAAFQTARAAVRSPSARAGDVAVLCLVRPPKYRSTRTTWSSWAAVCVGHFVFIFWFVDGRRKVYVKRANYCEGGELAAKDYYQHICHAKQHGVKFRVEVPFLSLGIEEEAGAEDVEVPDADVHTFLEDVALDLPSNSADLVMNDEQLDAFSFAESLEAPPVDDVAAIAAAPREPVDVVMTVATTAPAARERSQSAANRRRPWRDPSRARGQAVLARERSDAASEAFRALVPAPEVRNAERPAPAREVDAAVEQVSRVPYVAPFYVRVDLNGESTFFRIKQTTQMQKVVGALATRHGVPATSLCVSFRGARVDGLYTADMVGLCGGDTLDATIIAREAAPAPPQPVAPPPVRDAGPQLPPSSLVPEPMETASSSAARKRRPQDAAPRTPRKRARGDAGEDDIGWCMDQAGMATTPTRSVLLMAPCPAVTGLEMLAQPATPGVGWEPFQALGFSVRGGGAS